MEVLVVAAVCCASSVAALYGVSAKIVLERTRERFHTFLRPHSKKRDSPSQEKQEKIMKKSTGEDLKFHYVL